MFEKKNPQVRLSFRLCNNEKFHIPQHRTSIYQNLFHIQSAYFWHNLPPVVTSYTFVTVFRYKLFNHLLSADTYKIEFHITLKQIVMYIYYLFRHMFSFIPIHYHYCCSSLRFDFPWLKDYQGNLIQKLNNVIHTIIMKLNNKFHLIK